MTTTKQIGMTRIGGPTVVQSSDKSIAMKSLVLLRARELLPLILLVLILPAARARAQTLLEDFGTDPVVAGRFAQSVFDTESQFSYNPTGQNLTAVLDVDNMGAYYVSVPFAGLHETNDFSFSVNFTVVGFDDQANPGAAIGIFDAGHIENFGAGLTLWLTISGTNVLAQARCDESGALQMGNPILLQTLSPYLAIGHYQATNRTWSVSLFGGPGGANAVGGLNGHHSRREQFHRYADRAAKQRMAIHRLERRLDHADAG